LDENHRRFNAGKYPASVGGPGEASYDEGSSYGYYRKIQTPYGEVPDKKEPDVEGPLKEIRKILGVTKDGEKGTLGGLRTKKALEE
jgi:hypothetical protein